MELREINVEDVYPDEKNPRKDFGDIEALAESCMLNAVNPGEPVNPIVVVEDGGIYRIVDGERRYKAMRKNKLKRCHAVVCGDLDEANAMVAMVATDDKQQLSEIERSRGVQQMLLLGVDPERVERAGRMPKGSAAKLRLAREAVDDAGDDMTLDRMLAIAEFEELGDSGAVERLSSCRESEWQGVASEIRSQRYRAEQVAALREACAEAGIALEEESPTRAGGYSYRNCQKRPPEVAATAGELPDGTLAWICEDSYSGPEVRFYAPIVDEDDPEATARAERIHEIEAMIEASKTAHLSWFDARIDDLDSMPCVMEVVEDEALSGYDGIGKTVDAYEKEAGAELDRRFCPMLAAYGWRKASRNMELSEWHAGSMESGEAGYRAESLERFVEWLGILAADGYEPTEADLELKRMCEAALADDEEYEEEE